MRFVPWRWGERNIFAGSHVADPACGEGAERAAIIYSLVATAKRREVELIAYLKYVLTNISAHPHHNLAALLPEN